MNVKVAWKKEESKYVRIITQMTDCIGLPLEIRKRPSIISVFNTNGKLIETKKLYNSKRIGFAFPFLKGFRLEIQPT